MENLGGLHGKVSWVDFNALTGQTIHIETMPWKIPKKIVVISVPRFFERIPDEASARAFIEKSDIGKMESPPV